MFLTLTMSAKPIGDYSLAGNAVKFNLEEVPQLFCEALILRDGAVDECGWQHNGRFEDGHAVFDPIAQAETTSGADSA